MSVLAPEAVALDTVQREVLLEELAVFTVSLHDPQAQALYQELAEAVGSGEVEEPLLGRLEEVLEMLLQTGRARRVHGAQIEQSLLRLFHQTPRGSTARRATEAVNQALAGLAGQCLEGMLFTVQGPGVYRLGVTTDRCRLTLQIDRHGLSVESLEV